MRYPLGIRMRKHFQKFLPGCNWIERDCRTISIVPLCFAVYKSGATGP